MVPKMTSHDDKLQAMARQIANANERNARLNAADFSGNLTLDDAERVQRTLFSRPGLKIGSWKLGASTHASRAALSMDDCFVGAIDASRTIAAPATIGSGCLRAHLVECEVAVKISIGAWLAHPDDDAAPFIESVHPAFELPETRFGTIGEAGTAALVADYGAAGYAILGPGTDFAKFDAEGYDANVRLFVNGELQDTGEMSALVMEPLALLNSQKHRFSQHKNVKEWGDYILLGSLTPPQRLSRQDIVRAEFSRLGAIELHIQ